MQGILRVRVPGVVAIAVAAALALPGAALASPESLHVSGPGETLDVTPSDGDNLPTPANVTVIGAGFAQGEFGENGVILQCAREIPSVGDPGPCSTEIGSFNSNASGTFSETVSVTRTFTPQTPPGPPIDCGASPTTCIVYATTSLANHTAGHHISFFVPTPTDTDGDGVPDASDACPQVPASTPTGCPVVVVPLLPAPTLPTAAPTGQRATALAKCRKKKGKARKKCRKRAQKLPA